MKNKMPIQGPHRIPGFNGVGEINLEDYNNKYILPPEISSGMFSHIAAIDLNTVDENHPDWENLGIREKGNTEDRFNAFVDTFELDGWKTDVVPPIMGTNEIPIDGRGRMIAAKRRGERWMPGFYYTIEDNSLRSLVGDALKQNLRHPVQSKATRESVVTSCLLLIGKDELKCNEVAIRNYLDKDLNIEKSFSKSNITKIVNDTIARAKQDKNVVVQVKDRKKWELFCEEAGKKIDNKSVFLFCIDGPNYISRHWATILKASLRNGNDRPIELIIYTKDNIVTEAHKNMKAFRDGIEGLLESSYLMVERDYASDWPMGKLSLPVKSIPYKIVGCIPQVSGKHDRYFKMKQFVSIEDYC
jgi:hypothetical protein